MQAVFEKIIEHLENASFWTDSSFDEDGYCNDDSEEAVYLHKAIEIVKQEAEKFGTDIKAESNGWIPVDEELPKTDKYILLSFSNFSIPCVGRYEEDENGGAFYVGDDYETCVSQGMFVNAWMNLPAPYQPKGEIDE